MDFRDRDVVITGGTGALGTAVVEALIGAGAICHVPCFNEAEAQRFALRDRPQVKLVVAGNLADEAAIDRLYQSVGPLWASIHLAGGFAAGPLREASVATLRQQIDMNLLTCLLCCRAAMPKADYDLWPKVAEVAATIMFLASPDNRVTRGGIVPVYGRS